MNKSQIACHFSIDMLCRSGWSYLWTFTFPDSLSIDEAIRRWQSLSKTLVRNGFVAVRVFELHPGGHGLHIHAVTGNRYDVNQIRYFAESCFFGRLNVKRIPSSKIHYAAKYLSKRRPSSLKGRRLWSCLGFSGSKVCDIIIDSPISRMMSRISNKEVYDTFQFPASIDVTPRLLNFYRFKLALMYLNRYNRLLENARLKGYNV